MSLFLWGDDARDMLENLAARPTKTTRQLIPLKKRDLKAWLGKQRAGVKAWVRDTKFEAKRGQVCLVPKSDGSLGTVLLGVRELDEPWVYAGLPKSLPLGRYQLPTDLGADAANAAALGWALGTYRFDRYVKRNRKYAALVWPESADQAKVTRLVEGIGLGRDLINTPAGDMGPEELAATAKELAERHGAKLKLTVGDKLLAENYPAVHAVGRASSRAPRLIDFTWGDPKAPKLTLVGKGVCFDSGGLDLKSPANMKLMKKDMGGSATVLALAHIVMAAELPVRLRVLVPAVENSVSGNAFRPLDVLQTRKGITVEVGNTDAEGRLILCDALAEADSEAPDLIIDIATLTGAARVALGTDLPALFSNDDEAAQQLLGASTDVGDPLWRLPLHEPYRDKLKSPVADINNISSGSYGGAITAALFLREFVSKSRPWMHIDTMGWNLDSQPGRPAGGEPLGVRALAEMLERRYRPSEPVAEE